MRSQGRSWRRVAPCELPLERCRDSFIVRLEGEQTLAQNLKRREAGGGKNLALDNGGEYFDLVEPTDVYRPLRRNPIAAPILRSVNTAGAAMGSPVVHNPQDTPRLS